MTAVLEAEATRLTEQRRLDQLKTAKERNQWGQFATPPALSLEIARYAWDRLNRRQGGLTFLDPAIGTGSFFGAFRQIFPNDRIDAAMGIELDKAFAEAASAIWRSEGLKVIQGDFTKQKPQAVYNIILTNPPYVRHHHLLAVEKIRLGESARIATGLKLSGLSGLYCYFLLIAHSWLADNGLAVWLIPSEFMDVNYGEAVKRYLTERVTLIQIHRFCPSDVQFDDALVSSAIVVFEKRSPKSDHEALFSFGGTLAKPAKFEFVPLDRLRTTLKWTSLPQQGTNDHEPATVTLGDLFTVKRGLATGNNEFFIVPRDKLKSLGIPDCCVRPILPSPRFLRHEIIDADADGWPVIDRSLALIDCSIAEPEISRKWPHFAEYLAEGKKRGIHEGYLASRRSPWYMQERREAAPFVCTYMGRNRERPFRFIWNRSKATVANVYLALYPKAHLAQKLMENASEVFEALRAIHADHFFSQGRVYGGGLYKMEPAELMRLPADGIAKLLGVKTDQQKSLF
jgi:adenine-specific DNA-methyltransferase